MGWSGIQELLNVNMLVVIIVMAFIIIFGSFFNGGKDE